MHAGLADGLFASLLLRCMLLACLSLGVCTAARIYSAVRLSHTFAVLHHTWHRSTELQLTCDIVWKRASGAISVLGPVRVFVQLLHSMVLLRTRSAL
jgi:hypothetical protein